MGKGREGQNLTGEMNGEIGRDKIGV